MQDDTELKDFSNIVRLFPLPGVVLFPNAVLPLHIFEPRYRQMTADALSGDKLVTIVQYRTGVETPPGQRPLIESVACLGKIIQHEKLPDGRYRFLLLGLKRVRLVEELSTEKLYRTAQAEILEDEEIEESEEISAELAERFRALLVKQNRLDSDFDLLLKSQVPLGVLSDIIGHALPLGPALKQTLLQVLDPNVRAQQLIERLREMSGESPGHAPGTHWPPPFSVN